MALGALIGDASGPTLANVDIDVSLNETHTSTNVISDAPIETGSDITDHVKKMPDELRLEGVLSNAPSSTLKFIELQTSGDTAEARYAKLIEVFENREKFEVITGIRVYRNMLFKSISVPRNSATGQVIRFNAVMREVTFAQSETVEVAPNADDMAKVDGLVDRGPKATKPAAPPVAEQSRGAARKALSFTTGI